jgi:hypothetical protein
MSVTTALASIASTWPTRRSSEAAGINLVTSASGPKADILIARANVRFQG